MVHAVGCPRCRRPVPADAPFGSCPACLLRLGLGETPDGAREGTVAVTVAAATVSASGFASAGPDTTLSNDIPWPKAIPVWPDIPGHRIVSELGAGGGGAVYLAEQLGAGRRLVAVKVLHGTSRTERERLGREARSLGKLTHPNVVTLFEVGESADGPYFTMEYMSGGSLADRIRTARPEPAEAARIVEAVARAVQGAHEHGIRHRDLKPSNVLLQVDGTPKVADFGLAKLEESAGVGTTEDQLTHTGQLLGTPAYMAPEQAGRRHGEVTDRTDVYGLGAVLYHCLTGRPPYQGLDREDTLRQVLRDEIVTPRAHDRRVSRELEAVCLKCLEKDPRRRYATAGGVADELGRWERGEPTVVRPASGLRRMVRRAVRNRVAVAVSVAVLAAVILGAMVGSRSRESAEDRALRELQAEIEDGGPVTLIDADGRVRWHRVIEGVPVPVDSLMNDGARGFRATDEATLLLVPAPPPAGYVLRGEFRQDVRTRPDADRSWAGFEFGRWVGETPAGEALTSYRFVFRDLYSNLERADGTAAADLRVEARCDLRLPGTSARGNRHAFDGASGPASPVDGPKTWWRLEVVVRPDNFAAWWAPWDAALIPLPNAPYLSTALAGPHQDRWATRKVDGPAPPHWHPAGPISLIVSGSHVSIRNVVLEPLP